MLHPTPPSARRWLLQDDTSLCPVAALTTCCDQVCQHVYWLNVSQYSLQISRLNPSRAALFGQVDYVSTDCCRSGSLTQLGLPQLSTIGDISLSLPSGACHKFYSRYVQFSLACLPIKLLNYFTVCNFQDFRWVYGSLLEVENYHLKVELFH